MKSKIMLGPFSKIYRESNLLRLIVPGSFKDEIVEPALRDGLKISPDKIVRVYKNVHGYFWILVELKRGYDLYKHFRLAERDRYAKRIPRIVIQICPKCGEDLVDGSCLECGEEMRPKYIEVWRDPEAVEVRLGPVEEIKKNRKHLSIRVGGEAIYIDRWILHETITSYIRVEDGIHINILKIPSMKQ